MNDIPSDEDIISKEVDCIRAKQPIGDIYVCSIPHKLIQKMTYFDVRRVLMEERDVERYLGIQRPLEPKRVKSIQEYVNYFDASFPTGIILAIEDGYATYDTERGKLKFSNARLGETEPTINFSNLARVIDGQHRIAGLKDFSGECFDLPAIVFVGADIADQAQIFSTVNLEQTKVHKNLVYDLYSLARSRSPQKTCHNIAVALDQDEIGPFYHRIKRLGGATFDGRFEPISQATFVESLLKYITNDPKGDRDELLRGNNLKKVSGEDLDRFPMRNLFIEENDIQIAQTIHNLFSAIKTRWPIAWGDERPQGTMLNRTNGFRAVMRLYRDLYEKHGMPSPVLSKEFIENYLRDVELEDADFTVENFVPGSGGEGALYRVLSKKETLAEQKESKNSK